MSELPYMPSHVSDEIADTEHLTNEELGAFRRLIRAMWRAGGFLPDDTKVLARYSRAGKRWGQIAPALLAMMTVGGGKVSFTPLLAMLDLTRNRRRQAADAAGRRWAGEKSGKAALKSGFSGQQKVDIGRPQSQRKLLKVNNLTHATASSEHMLNGCNHNQNQYSSSLVGAAKRTSEEELIQSGAELLMHRVGLTALQAQSQIKRWLRQTGDVEALATVLAAADNFNLQGPNFVTVVDARVVAIETERSKGLALPFGLQKVSEANG